MDEFTIKDVENLSGIKAHTIRIWEQRYSFIKPNRTDTNIRYYTNEELKTILNISLLNKNGFKISKIDKMGQEQIAEKTNSLSNIEAQQERNINDLIKAMIDLDIDQLEIILNNFIATKGVKHTIINIIFPFLNKIGILWQTNHINPAQEHLVTNIIRQKIIVGIENCPNPSLAYKPHLLFLPEGEFHELGLLFVHFLFKNQGIKVYYVGSNVPIKDIGYLINTLNIEVLYTHITAQSSSFNTDRFLRLMSEYAPNKKTVVSGAITNSLKKKVGENYNIKLSLESVVEYISAL